MTRAILLLALASCTPAPSSGQSICEAHCTKNGMILVGMHGVSDFNCVCAIGRPVIDCEAAWSRADVALTLLEGCQQALNACVARGSR